MENASYVASFTNIPVVVVDEIAHALDCEGQGLTFEATGGWSVFTNKPCAHAGDSCLSNSIQGAVLSTTVNCSGELVFWWKGEASDEEGVQLIFKVADTMVDEFTIGRREAEDKNNKWFAVTQKVDTVSYPVTISFAQERTGVYTALDHFTWKPDVEPLTDELLRPPLSEINFFISSVLFVLCVLSVL